MENINKDIKKIILNYNNWNIEKIYSIIELNNIKQPIISKFNIEKLIIKCFQLGCSGFFINYKSTEALYSTCEMIKKEIDDNCYLKNLLSCHTIDKSVFVRVKNIIDKELIDFPTLLLYNNLNSI